MYKRQFILLAVCFRAAGGFHTFDLYFSFIGTLGWFWVGYLWHDRALILLNGALVTLLFTGIFCLTKEKGILKFFCLFLSIKYIDCIKFNQ